MNQLRASISHPRVEVVRVLDDGSIVPRLATREVGRVGTFGQRGSTAAAYRARFETRCRLVKQTHCALAGTAGSSTSGPDLVRVLLCWIDQ